MPVAEAPVAIKPEVAKKDEGVLFLNVRPKEGFQVNIPEVKKVRMQNGTWGDVETMRTRTMYFNRHRLFVPAGVAEAIRRRPGYGIHFMDAYPHPDIPKGELSLAEKCLKRPAHSKAFFNAMEHHGGAVYGSNACESQLDMQAMLLTELTERKAAGKFCTNVEKKK